MGLDELVETSDKDVLDILKKEFLDETECIIKKLAYPNEHFRSFDGYQKPYSNF